MLAPTAQNPGTSEPEKQILWDVIEEHLDEAAFLSTQWDQALVSPLYKLEEVRDRVEERLLAHVDGLVTAGTLAKERLLRPALWEGSDGVAFAAAMALLSDSSLEAEAAVIDALNTASVPQAKEVQRALELCPSGRRQATLLRFLSRQPPRVRAAAAKVLGFQKVDLGPALLGLFDPENEELFQAGLYCLRYRPRPDGEFAIRHALTAASDSLMTAGLLAGAVAGLREVLQVSRACIRNQHPATPTAALLLGFLGSEVDSKLLCQVASASPHAAAVIFALGLGGTRDAADACVEWLSTPALAWEASEAFLAITGADSNKEGLVQTARADPEPDSDAEDQEEDISLSPAGTLLDADAVEKWWQKRRGQYTLSDRYYWGRPLDRHDEGEWRAVLKRATMRQRHPLALAMTVSTASRALPQTFSLCRYQGHS